MTGKLDAVIGQHYLIIPFPASEAGVRNVPAVLDLAASRYSYGVKPVSDEVLREQQKIADAFAGLKLIPKPIAIKDAVLASAK